MKNPLLRSLTCLLTVVIFMSFTAQLHAAPVDLLRAAYVALSEADHDYKGHRVDAMKAIDAAMKELGEKVSGDGKDHVKQGVSDQHLRAAYNLLQQAQAGLSGKALKHVEKAQKEIGTALKIK